MIRLREDAVQRKQRTTQYPPISTAKLEDGLGSFRFVISNLSRFVDADSIPVHLQQISFLLGVLFLFVIRDPGLGFFLLPCSGQRSDDLAECGDDHVICLHGVQRHCSTFAMVNVNFPFLVDEFSHLGFPLF